MNKIQKRNDDMVSKKFYKDAEFFCELIFRHNTELMAWIFSCEDKSDSLSALSVDDLHMVNCTLSRIGVDLTFFYENIVPRLATYAPDVECFERRLSLFVKRVRERVNLPTPAEEE